MSVIPAATVSRYSDVEIRLAIKNNAEFQKSYKVDFFVDQYHNDFIINVPQIQFSLNPGEEGLAQYFWPPYYFPGEHMVLYRVIEVQGGLDVVVGSGEWPLTILDTDGTTPQTFTGTWIEPGELASNGNDPTTNRVVISEVYPAGGTAGATWTHDFVEIFNRGNAAEDVGNWSIQFASAAGSDTFSDNGVTTLSGTMQPGERRLVKLASGGGAGSALPTPDSTGSTSLHPTSGTVALVRSTQDPITLVMNPTPLACNGRAASDPCSEPEFAKIADFIGYGSAGFYDTAAAASPAATTALQRGRDGCLDRANNSLDLTSGTTSPANSSTTATPCHVYSEADLRDTVNEMAANGIDTLIITYPEFEWGLGWGAFYPSTLAHLGSPSVTWIDDVIGTIIDQADENNQHVYMGLGRGTCHSSTSSAQCEQAGPLDCNEGPTTDELNHVLQQSKDTADELWELYGGTDINGDPEHPSFYGWYLSHEFNDWDKCKAYYNAMGTWLDKFGKQMPVLVAPAGSVANLDTTELVASSVDVFAYQDAVGCGFDPDGGPTGGPVCDWSPDERIGELADVYYDYALAHLGTHKHLWDDLEVWRKPGPTYASESFAGDCDDVGDQMRNVRDVVSQLTAYGYLGYLQSGANQLNERPKGRVLYDAYVDYLGDLPDPFCP